MDGIQTYSATNHPAQPSSARPIVATVHAPTGHPGGNASAVKLPSDYLQAIRKRIWLALLIAIPIASAGTLVVLRMPAIYSVTAMMSIEPPKTDPAIRNLVGSGEMIVNDSGAATTYVPSTLAILNSKTFLLSVVSDKALGLPPAMLEGTDFADQLVGKIKPRIIPPIHQCHGHLRGTRPRVDPQDPRPHPDQVCPARRREEPPGEQRGGRKGINHSRYVRPRPQEARRRPDHTGPEQQGSRPQRPEH